MAIVELNKGIFNVDTYGLPNKRQRKAFNTLKECAEYLYHIATDTDIPKPNTPKLKDIVDAHINYSLSTNKITAVFGIRKRAAIISLKNILNLHVIQLNKSVMDAYVTKRLKKVKPATVKVEYVLLNSALNHAVSRGVISTNPIAGYWRGIKMDHKVNTIPMPDKLQEMFNALDDDSKKAVYFLLATGCRFSDMAELEVADIANKSIHFHHCKLGYQRYMPMPELPFAINTTGYVFTYKRKKWNNTRLRIKIKDACIAANIPVLNVHDCRRAHATYMLANGADTYKIMSNCGWKSINMVQRYAQVASHYSNTELWLPAYDAQDKRAKKAASFRKNLFYIPDLKVS